MSKLEKIKDVAMKQFAIYGYEATSINSIATEVGLKKSSIYSHINSKEGLFITLLEEVLEWDRDYFSELLKQNETLAVKEKIRLLFHNYCYIYHEEPYRTYIDFLNRSMIFPPNIMKDRQHSLFAEKENLFTPLLKNLIEEGFSTGVLGSNSSEEIIAYFYCLVDGLYVESSYYKEDDFDRKAEMIWNMFWKAIEA